MNLGVAVDQDGFDTLCRELKKLGHVIASPNMQLYRANKFRKFTIENVQSGNLGLLPISGATKIIAGSHEPEWRTGNLLEGMKVKPAGRNAADVGYFEDSSLIPGKNITYTRAAILQHTGYRIPLTGEKGERVRAWLAAKGVFSKDYHDFAGGVKSSDKWIIVPPRPFMIKSMDLYESTGEDIKAVDEFLNKMINSPIMKEED
jgi:hypothetical protein